HGGNVRNRARAAAVLATILLAACGDAPFASLGQRTSDWIAEPTVLTTTTIPTTVPVVISAGILKWFNDGLGDASLLGDPDALRDAIFARRAGDLFVQASRAEIAALVPELKFPSSTPYLSEYVTSQIVFDSDGNLSSDPIAAFGIWSSEPYTRSRSVAQMMVLRVSVDAEAAAEVAEPGAEISCARFSDRTTEVCAVTTLDGVPVWSLEASNGTTLAWFDEDYRYELFGRSFVAVPALQEMVSDLVPLSDLGTPPG
ncbi:MAG: hypothetical protein ACRDZM_15635, partial [Acidimicrobiia bacterium]